MPLGLIGVRTDGPRDRVALTGGHREPVGIAMAIKLIQAAQDR